MTSSSSSKQAISALQKQIWDGSLPLEIRLAPSECRLYDECDPYMIQCPRLSYLPFLLPRVHAFFKPFLITPDVKPHDGWFECEDTPLRWQHPVGLLYDLYSGAEPSHADQPPSDGEDTKSTLPWKLTVHFSQHPFMLIRQDPNGKIVHDSFINNVKEADFLRNGTAKTVMSLSKPDSQQLWESVQHHNLHDYNVINQKLLNPPGVTIRHVPIRVYLPRAGTQETEDAPVKGALRVVQGPVTPSVKNSRQTQTLGTALKELLPTLFPSTTTPMHAFPVLHGAVIPLRAPVEDLMRGAAYADGWVHLTLSMMGPAQVERARMEYARLHNIHMDEDGIMVERDDVTSQVEDENTPPTGVSQILSSAVKKVFLNVSIPDADLGKF